jgi:4-amino-4-deoxy-L-arabinose transferase-like glycosyltransferase
MSPARPNSPSSGLVSREVLIVFFLTIFGATIRLWAPNRLGLVHFDEGIYAIAGLWSVSPGGPAAIDPMVIAYAPPAFPILVGLSYAFFGVSDLAAILVSVLAGTLTIPATAWLAWRTFGAGAGACAAALVALSGFHIAFSRMALTDASFLLFWVLGLICGQRFLERPGLLTAVALGSSVGLAQLFKYNGWVIGAIVVLTAGLGSIFDPRDRTRSNLMAIWGLGLLAALVSAAIYWPWVRVVRSHGGYGRLLAHHQSYMTGIGSWLPHLRLQLDQVRAFSGEGDWEAAAFVAASVCLYLIVQPGNRGRVVPVGYFLLFAAGIFMFPYFYWFLGAIWILRGAPRTRGQRLLAGGWLFLSILTPFYHPYARLWLPIQHLGWVMMPDLGRVVFATAERAEHARVDLRDFATSRRASVAVKAGLFLVVVFLLVLSRPRCPALSWTSELPSPVSSTDSLRSAVRQLLAGVPASTGGLRLYVRPPVTFYLGGRVLTQVEPDLARIVEPGNSRLWALVDSAQLRQAGDLKAATETVMTRWELVHEYPTKLNLPTLLDIDPGAARAGRSDAVNAPLWLLRPRAARNTR